RLRVGRSSRQHESKRQYAQRRTSQFAQHESSPIVDPCHSVDHPPSTAMSCPVICLAFSLHRKATTFATSWPVDSRRSAYSAADSSRTWSMVLPDFSALMRSVLSNRGPSTIPGHTLLTLIL